ncbi:MAG TPA: hypothetical protein V6D02_15855, partial [Candidatus Obscuribacterales bacterium]
PYFIPTGLEQAVIAVPHTEPLRAVCEHFVACAIANRPSPISSGSVGTDLVRVLVALSQSLHNGGQPVSVPAP